MAIWNADDGTAINFQVYGDNSSQSETLILLPGMLGSIGTQWRNFISPLSRSYRVVLMDLRGHGRSENKASWLNPERMMKDILGLADYLHADTFHIAGYSLGGYLGLMLALNHPRRVSTLLMHATKFYWTNEAVANMRAQLDPDAMGQKVPGYANQLAQEHGGSHWRVLVRQAADLVGYLSQEGITEGMAAHTQNPCLISVGDRDELVSLPEAQRLSRVVANGELIVLPGVRHPFRTVREVPLLPMMLAFHKPVEKRYS
ncbi:MAG: alpha/beta hydrolase [Candidatus Promineifilaceae bacterium]